MQLGSPNLTETWSTMSPGLILGSKGQRSRWHGTRNTSVSVFRSNAILTFAAGFSLHQIHAADAACIVWASVHCIQVQYNGVCVCVWFVLCELVCTVYRYSTMVCVCVWFVLCELVCTVYRYSTMVCVCVCVVCIVWASVCVCVVCIVWASVHCIQVQYNGVCVWFVLCELVCSVYRYSTMVCVCGLYCVS